MYPFVTMFLFSDLGMKFGDFAQLEDLIRDFTRYGLEPASELVFAADFLDKKMEFLMYGCIIK